MSSYRQILYHVILRTKDCKKTLTQTHIKELYAYILGIIRNKNCMLYRINGIEDHIHILSDLHPGYALADYVKDIIANYIINQQKHHEREAFAEEYKRLLEEHGIKIDERFFP